MSLLERLGRGHLERPAVRAPVDAREAVTRISTAAPTAARASRSSTAGSLGIGDELRAEADEAFPAERLAMQQAQIARRLETLERPARVIAFPKAARAVISGHSHVRRWVTVAAAASLIAGFGLGQVVPLRSVDRQQRPPTAPPQPLTAPQTVEIARRSSRRSRPRQNDDELLLRRLRAARASARSARSTR